MFGRVSAIGTQAHSRATALCTWLIKDFRSSLRRRTGRIQLLPAVLLALAAGLGVAVAAYGFLRWITPVDGSKTAAEIDVTRIALTVVAGVGGVVALVIAYRRQRDLEQSRFVERFGAAAAQLGAADVAVRIAGAYAMAGVADESEGLRRQQCIDVLCGYLRLPYDTEHGASGRTKFVVKAPRIEHGRVRGETEEHIEYRQNDREVRATILRVIANRLRPPTEYSWSAYDFDFRNAYLEGVDFSNATFTGSAEFSRATFAGIAEFGDATFTRKAQFGGATFTGGAWFQNATFSSGAWFHDATFIGDVQFGEATFTRTAEFGGATFTGKIWFHYVTFAHSAWFNSATFTCDVSFNGATFTGDVSFHDATFTGDARFMKVSFGSGTASFVAPRQWGPPAPAFDWDQDLSQKPANVEPQDWPPTVAVPLAPS
ncbi:pentapeptide repeat-containing protein [Nocardia gipuzkoensis]